MVGTRANSHTKASTSKKASSSRRKSTGNPVSAHLVIETSRTTVLIVFLKDESRLMKRKEQNRAAQRAFRERKEKHVKDVSMNVNLCV